MKIFGYIVAGLLVAAGILCIATLIYGSCNSLAFGEAFKQMFGIAEKVVEDTPATEETVATIGRVLFRK